MLSFVWEKIVKECIIIICQGHKLPFLINGQRKALSRFLFVELLAWIVSQEKQWRSQKIISYLYCRYTWEFRTVKWLLHVVIFVFKCFVAGFLPWWSDFTSCFVSGTINCCCPCNFSFKVTFHLVIPLINNRKREPKTKCHIKKIRLACLQLQLRNG